MKIKNLGPIKESDLKLSNLTMFIGDNGTGKTLEAYSLYRFIKWFAKTPNFKFVSEEDVKNIVFNSNTTYTINLKDKLKHIIDLFNDDSKKIYENTFSSSSSPYKENTKIEIGEDDIRSILKDKERIHQLFGINWKYSEDINSNSNDDATVTSDIKNSLVYSYIETSDEIKFKHRIYSYSQGEAKQLQLPTKNEFELVSLNKVTKFLNKNIKQNLFSTVSVFLPAERIGISTFIDELNLKRSNQSFGIDNIFGDDENFEGTDNYSSYPLAIEDYIKYLNNNKNSNDDKVKLDKKLNSFLNKLIPGTFVLDESSKDVKYAFNNQIISFSLLSSSLKSLYGLDLILKNKTNDEILFIDEPEMNLSPKRQKMIIDMLFNLVKNKDMKIVISTHSDYIVKELVNLLLEDKVNGIKNQDLVSIYQFSDGKSRTLGYLTDLDTDFSNFDEVTNEINEKYYQLSDKIDKYGKDDE